MMSLLLTDKLRRMRNDHFCTLLFHLATYSIHKILFLRSYAVSFVVLLFLSDGCYRLHMRLVRLRLFVCQTRQQMFQWIILALQASRAGIWSLQQSFRRCDLLQSSLPSFLRFASLILLRNQLLLIITQQLSSRQQFSGSWPLVSILIHHLPNDILEFQGCTRHGAKSSSSQILPFLAISW